MKDLVETMQRLGTTEFVEAMRGIGLTKRHLRHANYTIFAPTNGALQEADLQSVSVSRSPGSCFPRQNRTQPNLADNLTRYSEFDMYR